MVAPLSAARFPRATAGRSGGPVVAPNAVVHDGAVSSVTRWRLQVARRIAAIYAANSKVAAVAVAGSVGAGLEDQWSDLEIDLYWRDPPDDHDRRGPIREMGGQIVHYWPYSADEEEWGEEYLLGKLQVGVSGYLVSSAERFVVRVTEEGDPNTNAQMRVAAIQVSVALEGEPRLAEWKARAARYPDELQRRMVGRYLDADRFGGWHLREALAERDDYLAVHDLLVRSQRSVLGALHGLNRRYLSNPTMKWEQSFLASLDVAPEAIGPRSARLWHGELRDRVAAAERLVRDIVDLAETHTAVDLGALRGTLGERRPALPTMTHDGARHWQPSF